MTETIVSVCWRNHSNELSTIYKDLVKNNFLVDCTLSAEGQNLKAHRLILSACSPYFHMLFREETEKHPFVILLHATFETMKAVIDFMYQGEAHIPKRNLEAFLSLAHSLQIKGLDGITRKCNKDLSGSISENIADGPSTDYQETRKNQSIDLDKDSAENCSLQHHHHSDGYTNTHTDLSVPFGACSASRTDVQTDSVVSLPQDPLGCDEVAVQTEISVKPEPLGATFSETNNTSENIESDEPQSTTTTTKDFMSEMEEGTDIFHEQDLNQYSSCPVSSQESAESSVMPRPQLSCLSNCMYSELNVANQHEPVLPILEPKIEPIGDAGSEELMDDQDVPGNYINKEIESACFEENLDRRSRAGEQEAVRHGGGQRVRAPEGAQTSGPTAHAASHAPQPRFTCGVCPTTFTSCQGLRYHQGQHAGFAATPEPHRCDVCGKVFIQKVTLLIHQRTHTGERPYQCDLCGRAFSQKINLDVHRHKHTGRPYRCDVCGAAFALPSSLANHKRKHGEKRPHRCDVCSKTFVRSTHLAAHLRTHTGERPYRCEVCGRAFGYVSTLDAHKRRHTGERPYRCDVCGNAYARVHHLVDHKRLQTGERPYRCDVCGQDFTNASSLTNHKRKHGEEQT